jgi:rubrerythrin
MSRLAHLLNPIVWRLPGRPARKLFAFARAERGSMIDLMQAARTTPSPARAAMYLRHAADEARHARLFAQRSAELRRERGAEPLGEVRADTEDLFDRLGEIDFLAFVHRGEQRGRAQFETYHGYFVQRGARADSALFEAILADERRHESYTRELLVELAGGEAAARAALRRMARWEAWRTWRRAGRGLAAWVYAMLMFGLYVLTMPLAVLVRAVRPVRRGWLAAPDGDAGDAGDAAGRASRGALAAAKPPDARGEVT